MIKFEYDSGISSADGFPWAVWEEDKPSGKREIVNCFIAEGSSRELLFAADGGVLPQPIYRQRRWEKLVGFRSMPAKELYYSGVENRLRQEFMNKSAALRIMLPDDAVVMLADFADDYPSVPVHINCGIGTQVEINALHGALHRAFIAERWQVVESLCGGEFKVPDDWDKGPLLTETSLMGMRRAWEEAVSRDRNWLQKLFGWNK